MKKFKSKLLIFLLAVMLPITSFLFVGNQGKNTTDVYAALSDVNKSDYTKFEVDEFTTGSHTIEKNLFADGTATADYYGILATTSGGLDKVCSKVVENNGVGVYVKGTSFTSTNVKVFTSVIIPDSILTAAKKSFITIEFSADMYPKYGDEHYFTVKNNSVEKTSDSVKDKVMTNKKVSFSSLEITDNEFYIEFVMDRPSGKTQVDTQFQIYNPKVTITTTDKSAPRINFASDTNTDKRDYRTINFSVTDNNGTGIKYVKFNGNEYNNVADGTSYSFDADFDKDYIIEVCDNVGNINKETIQKDNNIPNKPILGGIDSSIHSEEINFMVEHTADSVPHSASEKIYYTIVSFTDYLLGNYTLDSTCSTLNVGSNSISLGYLTAGTYVFLAKTIDIKGVESELSYVKFEYDVKLYTLSLPELVGGKYTGIKVNGREMFLEGTPSYNISLYNGDVVKIDYQADEGYRFFDIVADGDHYNLDSDKFSNVYAFCYSKQSVIDIKFRYITHAIFDSEYVFNAQEDYLLEQLTSNFVVKDEMDNSLENGLIEFLVYDSQDNLVAKYNSDNDFLLDGDFYNADTYKIVWNIVEDLQDEYVIKDTNIAYVTIAKKVISGIAYLDYENLKYSVNGNQILFDLSYSNLEPQEKIDLVPSIVIDYYKAEDTGFLSPLSQMTSVGTYNAYITIANSNYQLNDSLIGIEIGKKDIMATLNKSTYKYNENVLELDLDIQEIGLNGITITFEKLVEESFEPYEFKGVGKYRYSLTLKEDYINDYNLIGNIGSDEAILEIEKQDVYFEVTKFVYDYTGSAINLEYAVYDSDGESKNIIVSANNVFSYVNASDSSVALLETGTYSVIFASSDDGYILHNETFENIKIDRTTISIEVVESYEFDGTQKTLQFVFKNEEGVVLENVNGITPIIKSGEDEIENFSEVGIYSYSFEYGEKFLVSGMTSGTFEVFQAVVIVEIETEYEFVQNESNLANLENYNISYSLISTKNTDFSALGFVNLTITKGEDITNWGDVGVYTYTFESISDSVKLKFTEGELSRVLTGTITITPKKVFATVTGEYEYNAQNREIMYQIDNFYGLDAEDIELVILGQDQLTFKDFGKYFYTISSKNANYEVVIIDAQVEDGKNYVQVTKKLVSLQIQSQYTYSGESIEILPEIENPFGESISFAIVLKDSLGNIVENIINAGNYSVNITSENNNYQFDCEDVSITIIPKTLNVEVVDEISLVYNANVQTISYELKDGAQVSDIQSFVEFLQNGVKVNPINVGVYTFEIKLPENGNYKIERTIGTLTILPKEISVSAISGQTKVYGDEDRTIEYSISGVIGNDVVELSLIRESGEDVGLYEIKYVENSLSNSNYTVNFKENTYFYEITAKKLVIIANKQTKEFGEEDQTLTYKMLLGGEIKDKLLGDDLLTGTLVRSAGEDVGSYDITLGTLNNPNYSITFVKSTYVIVPKVLNVIISDISVVYGESKQLEYTIEENYNSEYIFGNIARETGNNVGSYEISKGTLSSTNYQLVVQNGVYSIVKKDLVVCANKTSKIYGDADNLTYTCSGLEDGDILEGSLAREIGEDVGEYEIYIGTLNNDNYNILFTSNTLTIEKAKLSIKFKDKTQVYGETPVAMEVEVTGLIGDDTFDIRVFREAGEDVGTYEIIGAFTTPSNYVIEEFIPGKYTITKAQINLNLPSQRFTYNGKAHFLQVENFDFPVNYVYKLNGFVVDNCIDAGTYSVYAEFAGNNNYYPKTSNEATLIIDKQYVFITITNDKFIYDNTIKYPEFSYDKNIGLDENSFTFKFENDIYPREEGEFNFIVLVDNSNFEGQTQGVVKVQKVFTIENSNSSIVECEQATFNEQAKNIKLVQNVETKKFNNEKVLSVCKLENVDEDSSDYLYTVKVKATEGVSNVKVYKVGVSGYSQQAIKIENGYYVFQISDPNDKYIITTEGKELSTLSWILILVCVVLVFGITLLIVLRKKHKKAKVLSKSKVSNKNIDTYNEN